VASLGRVKRNKLVNSKKVPESISSILLFLGLFITLLLFVEFTFLFGGGILVLLVLRYEIVHVALGLSELHLVHTLTSVPMEESLSPEHSSKLLADSLEQLLDGGAVSDEGGGHLESSGRNVTDGGLHVVRDPFDEVAAVLVLYVQHLLINLLHGHSSSEHGGNGQVSAVSGITGSHHVLGVEHLLGQLRDGQSPVLLGSSAGQRGESRHEEMKSREGHHVDGEFPEIGVQLSGESETGGDTRHGGGDEMVQVTVCGGGQLEGPEADVVEGLVINGEGLIGVLDELMDREGGVVGLDNGVGHLGGWDNGEGGHDPVGVFLSDLGDQESSHSGSGSTSKRVGQLESLETVTALSFLPHNIQNRVDELSSLGVVSLGPVVSSTRLSEDEVIRSEDLSEWSGSDGVHGTGLQINKDSSGNVLSTGGLVVVHIDPLQLEIRVSVVGSGGVNTVLIRDNFPELSSDLVAALASLQMNDFSHD